MVSALEEFFYSLCRVVGGTNAAGVIVRCDVAPSFRFCSFFVSGLVVPIIHYCVACAALCLMSLVHCIIPGTVYVLIVGLVSGGVPGLVPGTILGLVSGSNPGVVVSVILSLVSGGVPAVVGYCM